MKAPQANPSIPEIATPAEVPDGAHPSRVRFARWDGGPLEVGKGILSGWYYMRDPRAIEATLRWYDDAASLELLLAAHINWIWVTFSNGFSHATERPTQERLTAFIARCHAHDIRVTAYASMCNIFIADMRRQHPDVDDWLQRDADGNPIPYGAARYEGAPTRLLACLHHPAWRAWLSETVQRIVAAGCDALMYDNMWTDCRCDRCRQAWRSFLAAQGDSDLPWPESSVAMPLSEQVRVACRYDQFRLAQYQELYALVRQNALPANPRFLVYGNFNPLYQTFTLPTNNVVSTENGEEPGLVDGRLVSNFGLLRTLVGAGAGWRPVHVEYGCGRGRGQLRKHMDEAGVGATRFVPMEPVKHQLALAEAAAHGANLEITPEGEFLRDLHFREPAAMHNWRAIARYNRFLAEHEELYADTRAATRTVSLPSTGFRRLGADDRAQRSALIGALAERGVILDVCFEQDLRAESLDAYQVLLLADVWSLSPPMVEAARRFAARGGHIVATGQTGWYDRQFRRVETNLLAGLPGVSWLTDPAHAQQAPGASETKQGNFYEQYPQDPRQSLDEELTAQLAEKLLALDPPAARVQVPSCVLHHVTRDSRDRLLIHLLNYDDAPQPNVRVTMPATDTARWEWFSPDPLEEPPRLAASNSIEVGRLTCYGVLRATPVQHNP
jgi:hypothetical protein